MTCPRPPKSVVQQLLGTERARRLRAELMDRKEWAARRLNPADWTTFSLLSAAENEFRGERAVILGNGPSLRETDLSLLQAEATFGLNRVSLLFDQMGFPTTFLVCINDLVLQQVATELASTPSRRFFRRSSRKKIPRELRDGIAFLHSNEVPRFSTDPRHGVWEGATVTFVALQLAFWMGFEEVLLVGVDHRFSTTGPANATVVSGGDDPNHFAPNYFGKGFAWQLPDLEMSEHAYRAAHRTFLAAHRRVIDCTVGGALTVFPKSSLETEL